jgi:hypothetical protein
MKTTILVAAGLGGFKAYQIDRNELHRTPHLELLEEYTNNGAHDRLTDRVSDLSGRFRRSAGPSGFSGAMSDGERHNLEFELRKRLVRQMARRLDVLLGRNEIERCFLAAGRDINHLLLEELDARSRNKIDRNLPVDLTKADRSELLRHFQPPNRPASPDQRATL